MQIDLTCDLGRRSETACIEAESELWPVVSSVAIPSGAHAGDPTSMLDAFAHASARGIAIGAALGYRDRYGGGERFIDYSADDLTAELLYQLGGLDALAVTDDSRLAFVRCGGALQEAAQSDRGHAWAVVNAVLDFDASLTVVGRAGSRLLETAERHGLTTAVEFLPHRAPAPGGALGEVIADPSVVAERAVAAVRRGGIDSIWLPSGALSERAVALAVHRALTEAGCEIVAAAGTAPMMAEVASIGRRAG